MKTRAVERESGMETKKESREVQQSLIECPSCGAHFARTLPACPYCGSTNPEGAEKEYMEDLGEIREDLSELGSAGIGAAAGEIRRHGRFLKRTLLIAAAVAAVLAGLFLFTDYRYERESQKDFLWQRQNFPVMDEFYEAGDYTALAEYYVENGAEGNPVWNYPHAGLLEAVLAMKRLDSLYEEEKAGFPLGQSDLEWLLEDELTILLIRYQSHATKEDRKWVEENSAVYRGDFEQRFSMDEETFGKFEKYAKDSGGYIDHELVKELAAQAATR